MRKLFALILIYSIITTSFSIEAQAAHFCVRLSALKLGKDTLNKQLQNIYKDWPLVESAQVGDEIFIQTKSYASGEATRYFIGTVKEIEKTTDNETLLIVVDSRGTPHVIDQTYTSIEEKFEMRKKPTGVETDVSYVVKASDPYPTFIRSDRLKKLFCAMKSKLSGDPRVKKIEDYVRKTYRYSNDHLIKMERGSAAIASGLTAAGIALVFEIFGYRDKARRNGERTWFSEHGSNGVEGMSFMGLTYMFSHIADIAIFDTQYGRYFLTATLGAQILGNIWEEIDIPGIPQKSLPVFNSKGQDVQTDIEDFKSGVIGAMSFFVLVKMIESRFEWSYVNSCTK